MVHLHVHTEYSLRDSLVQVEGLLDRAKELEMSAVAITDHGNLSAALDFYIEAKKKKVKPIIGMEAYIVPDLTKKERKRHHLTLLAKNEVGYKNLIKLASIAGVEGMYYSPRLDLPTIAKHRQGLIASTACSISSVLYMAGKEKSGNMLRVLRKVFKKGNLFLEIMPHALQEQKEHNLMVLGLSEEYDVPLVATQDVHYLHEGDKEVHDVLMKIQERDPYECTTLFLGSESEIATIFLNEHKYLKRDDVQQAIKNSDLIASMVEDYNIPIEKFEYPIFRRKENE